MSHLSELISAQRKFPQICHILAPNIEPRASKNIDPILKVIIQASRMTHSSGRLLAIMMNAIYLLLPFFTLLTIWLFQQLFPLLSYQIEKPSIFKHSFASVPSVDKHFLEVLFVFEEDRNMARARGHSCLRSQRHHFLPGVVENLFHIF